MKCFKNTEDPCDFIKRDMENRKEVIVSVVLPTYNNEGYVQDAIESVLYQTFQDFEFVIVDDGSEDRTVEIIEGYKDPRIRLFRMDRNRGFSVAFNRGITESRGRYIAMLAADDIFLPDKLEKQVAILESRNDLAAVFSHVQVVNDDKSDFTDTTSFFHKIFDQPNRSRHEWLKYFFTYGNCLCHPSSLIRRSVYKEVGLHDPRLTALPDLDVWIKICSKYDIHVIPEKLVKFRIRKGQANLTGDRPETRTRASFELYEVLKHFMRIQDISEFNAIFPEAKITEKQYPPELIPFCVAKCASLRINSCRLNTIS